MWKRQEIQKVPRRHSLAAGAIAVLCLAQVGAAAILPEQFGAWKRVAKGVVNIADRPVWEEYGFQTAEKADYEAAGKRISVSAWQLNDTTGAWAASRWLQPGVIQHGNYVLRIEGALPPAQLPELTSKLPKVDRAANPSLPQFLPDSNRIKQADRYLLGPVSLAKFEPRISADLAGFNKGAEGQLSTYKTPGGEAKLVVFSYPTPQIAGDRFRAFENKGEWRARRHGPMVAVALDATPEAAETLLASVKYQPKVSWSEHVPKNENPGEMLLAICILAGALMAASVAFGLFFGGLRQVFGSKFGVQAIDDNFTSLHIEH
jgi:hypothetical protein